MKASSINQLLITAALVGTLAACSGAQTPGAAPVVTTPIESAETPTAAVVEATEETTTEATTEATDEATTEATTEVTGEATGEATTEAMTETTTVTSTEATTETTPGNAAATAVAPLDQAQCEAIQMAVDEALGVSTTLSEAAFVNTIANQEGQACLITATGTGEDFGNFLDVAQSLRGVLEAEGWTENPAYVADSPTGTAFAYESGNQLAFVSVDWQPSEDAECPENQPISACELEPSQQLYTIKLELVQVSQ
jgi:hypothetical protein